MSLAIVYSRAQVGIAAPLVTVEAHLGGGLPALAIVGLPEKAVQESKDRVRSAIINSHFEFPERRITINLAPADLPKSSGRYDLAIALGILAASNQVPAAALEGMEFYGELALSGDLRAITGVLPAVVAAAEHPRTVILPRGNAAEAGLVMAANSHIAGHLLEVTAHLRGIDELPAHRYIYPVASESCADLAAVRGQTIAKRALEIAAAGGHNLLMVGPPGSGKTMLATRIPGILPQMTQDEALAMASIYSVRGNQSIAQLARRRPFRAPHHTASAVAMTGGGSNPLPGEISLAHNGVLFLDELPEFPRHVLEVMREPLESGEVCISRAARQVNYPANFQLIAAMNPCPCGYLGDAQQHCHCSPDQIRRYRSRVSGPLLDRIDMHIQVPRVATRELTETAPVTEDSATVRKRVVTARNRQLSRAACANAQLSGNAMEKHCKLQKPEQTFLLNTIERMHMSARSYHRVLRVARTIADLAGSDAIEKPHLAEALSYRALDREA